MTYSAWIKSDVEHTGSIFNVNYDGNAGLAFGTLSGAGTGDVGIRYRNGASNLRTFAANVEFEDGDWHHVVATVDGTGNSTGVVIYMDGVDVTNTYTSSFTPPDWSAIAITDVTISSPTATVGGGYFDGVIDEVRVYDRILTGAEITRLYNLGN
jgi:hypothetical protein